VAVLSGTYDNVQNVLTALHVPCTLDPALDRLTAPILFVNCSSAYREELAGVLADRVEAGATLVTSDWALGNLIEHAFPGTIRWTRRSSGDEVVSVEPSLDSLWSETVVLGVEPQWWLENSSHPIEVLDTDRVRVEAASHDLLARYDAPVVAVRFGWGRGDVFHVMSHFWHNRSRTPTERHNGPCTDFMRAGMRLSDAGIAAVLDASGRGADNVNFAMLQSAVASTELVAQLCVRAIRQAGSRREQVPLAAA